MITIEKLKEYQTWEGRDDLYQLQGEFGKNIIAPKEWALIENLRGETKLLVKDLASRDYASSIHHRLEENCENLEVVEYLKMLARKDW